MRVRPLALALLGTTAVLSVSGAVTAAPAFAQAPGTTAAVAHSCATPSRSGQMSCFALRRTDGAATGTMSAMSAPSGYGPSDLRSAYKLPGTGGTGATVAIVDAYDDPKAESDLAAYRSQYGQTACTTGNGCFRKVNQNGAASPMPAADSGWAGEISLDLDMVSAICPGCHILLVEANSANDTDLFAAIDRAVTMGAKYVSNSWGGGEYSGQVTSADTHFNRPGVVFTASTGDNGAGTNYPATSRYVTAVGGTSLSRASNSRGWTERAWSGAGSGCSAYDAKPSWQTVSTGCARRAEADVSAVSDPSTGVAVYQTYGGSGWAVYGGTSAAAPIVASVYALAGTPGSADYPAAYPYAHQSSLFDVTAGSNGSCSGALCNSGTGWDGPTGLGTPNGTAAFAAAEVSPGPTAKPVTVTAPGDQSGTVGQTANLTLAASGGSGTFTWSATGLPTGLSLAASTGVISGTPTATGTFQVTATATSGTDSGHASFAWTVAPATVPACTARQLLGNTGFESGSTPWTTTPDVVSATSAGELAHAGTHYAWLDGYGTSHTDSLAQTVPVPAGCHTATLSFWLRISSADTGTVAHDILTVKAGNTVLAGYSNVNRAGYALKSFSLADFIGTSVTVTFTGVEDASKVTSFVVDDVTLTVS